METNPIPNMLEINRLIDWAEKNETAELDEWYQNAYATRRGSNLAQETEQVVDCGTAFCIAGKVCQEAGMRFLFAAGSKYTTMAVDEDGKGVNVDTYATRYLGLTIDEAYDLFKGDNDVETLRRVAARIESGYYRR